MSKGSIGNMSTAELQRELRKRERGLRGLQRTRERLASRIQELDAQIMELGGVITGLGGVRKRAKNDAKLVDALVKLLSGKTMGVTEASIAVQKAGYKTTSPNFRTIVNQALIKDKRFKRVERGQYTARG